MERIAILYQQLHAEAKAAINNSERGKNLTQIQVASNAIQTWRQLVSNPTGAAPAGVAKKRRKLLR